MSSDRPPSESCQSARFIRWQSISITQFTVVIALLSALSISMLGTSFIFVLNREFPNPGVHGIALGLSMLSLVAVVLLCVLATVSRMLDFRLTARKTRGRLDLKIFGLNKDQYSELSWGLFWTALSLFLGGGFLFFASAALLLAPRLLCGA